jgi:hypothetical protein CLOST_1278
MFSEFYFYLIVFMVNKDDEIPIVFRIDRITEVRNTNKKFDIPYNSRFEDGEFRKRIQFMYSGKLHKVKFEYTGLKEVVLDRLPTAEIKKVGNLNFNKYSDDVQRFVSELEEIDSIIDQNQSILVKSNWEIITKEWEIKGVENKITFFHKKIKALKEVFIDYDLQKDELIINDTNEVYPYTFELKKFIREIKNKYNSKLYNEVCKINNYKKELSQEINKENKFTNVWTETNRKKEILRNTIKQSQKLYNSILSEKQLYQFGKSKFK